MPMNYHDLTTIYNSLTGKNVPTEESVAIQQTVQPIVEKTTVIVEQAKEKVKEPLADILAGAARIIKKAVPTALAACASLQYTGGRGSFAAFLQPANLRSKYLRIGVNRSDRIGYPLEDYKVLNTLSGFVLCESVRLEIPGTANASGATLEEQQLIKQYLENGCYIE